jgi:AcrR family transcriptional regulator
MNAPLETDPDPKRARILDGAMKVFLTYGYQRVTMEDIARAAEISRPALYLLFRNKADIYRAIGAALLERSAASAEEELAREGSFVERMMAAIERALIGMMKAIMESPHGAEILDHKNTLAGDLAAEWRSRLRQTFCKAVLAEAKRSNVDLTARGLTAQSLADLLLDGLEGMKSRVPDAGEQRKAAERLVRVIALALQG